MSIDQQFVEFVIKSLVTKPDAVQIERRIDEKGVLLELTVDPEDLGRVIGKRGATAQSVRTLLRALGTKNDARYNLKIVDNGVGSSDYPAPQSKPQSRDDQSEPEPEPEAEVEQSQPEESEPQEEKVEEKTAQDDPWSSSSSDDSGSGDDETNDDGDDEDEESESVARTRRELKDLDDLDV